MFHFRVSPGGRETQKTPRKTKISLAAGIEGWGEVFGLPGAGRALRAAAIVARLGFES